MFRQRIEAENVVEGPVLFSFGPDDTGFISQDISKFQIIGAFGTTEISMIMKGSSLGLFGLIFLSLSLLFISLNYL